MSSNPAKAYKRWRHTRGFGVHSPFGFRLIERVVHPGRVAWYGYSRVRTPRGRFLLRLVAVLAPAGVVIPADTDPEFREAVRCADSRLTVTTGIPTDASRMLLFIPPEKEGMLRDPEFRAQVVRFIRGDGNALLIFGENASEGPSLFEEMNCGLLFHSPTDTLIANRPGMHKVAYPINFPKSADENHL